MNKLCFLIVFLLFVSLNANARIYQCTTKSGAISFSDKPCPSESKENEIVLKELAGSPKLIEATALDGKVLLLKPEDFKPMSKETKDFKFPYLNQPDEVLSDPSLSVTIGFSYSTSKLEPADFEKFKEILPKMFKTAKWSRNEIINQNGTTYIVSEFTSTAIDTIIHNIMYTTSLNGQMLLISFNTTEEKMEKWLPIGQKIMSSISIRN